MVSATWKEAQSSALKKSDDVSVFQVSESVQLAAVGTVTWLSYHVMLMNVVAAPVKRLKPKKITIVTIGSRGDVQPFIAFALALQKSGHKVRLATHGTYTIFTVIPSQSVCRNLPLVRYWSRP